MDTRKAMDGQAAAVMTVLCLVWSMQQVGLKATAQDVAPILQIALRSGVAAMLVGLLLFVRKENMAHAAAAWRPGLAAGGLFALEYVLLGAGLRLTSSAHAVVFLYTGPLFAALGLHMKLPSERLGPVQWLGVALAFTGIGIAFIPGASLRGTGSTSALLGDFLGLAAGAAWGATTLVIRCSSLSTAPAAQTLLYQLTAGCVLLLVAATLLDQLSFNPTPLALGNLVFQTLIVSFASFLAWFHLLRRYLASRLGIFSFMTPLFGVLLGAWLLNERIALSFMVGAGLVLGGIVLVSVPVSLAILKRKAAQA
ncbi:DMT family transporter [Pseudoduganella sp. LjRoot289]|uniref:DMT family transporter n=1 Tax=Pseudoduganella sp. LjRoot289 TaxID=3342314 RepID=UPI003ECEAAEF